MALLVPLAEMDGVPPSALKLVVDSETVFISRTNGDLVEFLKDSEGMVTGFIFHQGGVDQKAVRKGNAPR